MLETLLGWDRAASAWVNTALAHPVLDGALAGMASYSHLKWALPPLILLAIWLGRWRGVAWVLLAAAAVGLGEGLILGPLKDATARPRPWQAHAGVRHVRVSSVEITPAPQADPPARRSFPSSHAANNAAAAVLLLAVFGRRLAWVLLWPLAMAFSRVYTGDHYLSDALVGLAIGTALGAGLAWAARPWLRRLGAGHKPSLS